MPLSFIAYVVNFLLVLYLCVPSLCCFGCDCASVSVFPVLTWFLLLGFSGWCDSGFSLLSFFWTIGFVIVGYILGIELGCCVRILGILGLLYFCFCFDLMCLLVVFLLQLFSRFWFGFELGWIACLLVARLGGLYAGFLVLSFCLFEIVFNYRLDFGVADWFD